MSGVQHDSETPANGQRVITACAFIHHSFDGIEKVFLPKRAATKKFLPGVHELPGGHINFGEDLEVGLKREIMEEFQMNIKVGDPFYAFACINEVKGSHSAEIIYFAVFTDSITQIKINPEDHSGYGWFAESELDKIINNIKGNDDPDLKAIAKGFQLLKGNSLNFG